MHTALAFLRTAVARISRAVAISALLVAIAAGAFQILARFVLGEPSTTSEVLIRASLVWMVFFGLPLCILNRHLAAVTFLRGLLPPRWSRRLDVAVMAVVAGLCAYLAYHGFGILERVQFQKVAGLGISIVWMYLAIPLGSVLSAVAALACLGQPPAHAEIREV